MVRRRDKKTLKLMLSFFVLIFSFGGKNGRKENSINHATLAKKSFFTSLSLGVLSSYHFAADLLIYCVLPNSFLRLLTFCQFTFWTSDLLPSYHHHFNHSFISFIWANVSPQQWMSSFLCFRFLKH